MSDRNSAPVGHPSLRESTASCWGLLGSALTWQPAVVADTSELRGHLGPASEPEGEDAEVVRVIDLGGVTGVARGARPTTGRR